MNCLMATIKSIGSQGFHVLCNVGGQYVTYGPMGCLAELNPTMTTEQIPLMPPPTLMPGDQVVIAQLGPIPDQFVILGKFSVGIPLLPPL